MDRTPENERPTNPQPGQPARMQPPNPAASPYGSPAPGYCGAPYTPQPPQKKNRGWVVALVAVVLFFLLMFAGLAFCTSVVNSAVSSSIGMGEESALDSLSGDAIGVIAIDGTIDYDGSTASPEGLKAQLDQAEANPHIKAVVLRVNSGGGTATAGEEMAAYVRDFSKPIVVSSASMNASAAYEISSQADYIFTAKTTAIGAIGTAMQVTDVSGLLDKLGITIDNITSAESKDSSYGTRPLTDEERAYYQAMVDSINKTFVENVAAGRNMTTDEVSALATGMTFTGMDAVGNGLADEIGTREDAIDKAADLGGARNYTVVSLEPSSSDLSSLVGLLSSNSSTDETYAQKLKELSDNDTQH